MAVGSVLGKVGDAATRVAAPPLRLATRALRHPWGAAIVALVTVLAVWTVAGGALEGWAIGLGMDEQRGQLIAGLVVVLGASALATIAGGRALPARCGALAGLSAVVIVPLLVGATHSSITPGLSARPVLWGWVAQPIGMLLLGLAAATAGSALGALLRSDALGIWAWLRRHRVLRLLVVPVLVVTGAGWQAATSALQDGPLASLYTYAPSAGEALAPPPGGLPVGGFSASQAEPLLLDGPAAPVPAVATSGGSVTHKPTLTTLRRPVVIRPGHLETLQIGGRAVEVYLPAAYASDPLAHFPVVYFLHGYPGNQTQWISGGQLGGVLDQLIATGYVPPLIAVLPDGDGQVQSDAEWGDTAAGDTVETWLVDDVVPAVNSQLRTLGARFRGIAGLSAGGFGAANIATQHPDVFRWAASYSGYFTARSDIFGSTANANSPAQTVTSLTASQRMPMYIGIGTLDSEFLSDNRQFVAQLRALDWSPLVYETVPGGHGWQAWRLQMVQSLEWLGELWGPSLRQLPAPTPTAAPSPSASASPAPSSSPGPPAGSTPTPNSSPSPAATPTPGSSPTPAPAT